MRPLYIYPRLVLKATCPSNCLCYTSVRRSKRQLHVT